MLLVTVASVVSHKSSKLLSRVDTSTGLTRPYYATESFSTFTSWLFLWESTTSKKSTITKTYTTQHHSVEQSKNSPVSWTLQPRRRYATVKRKRQALAQEKSVHNTSYWQNHIADLQRGESPQHAHLARNPYATCAQAAVQVITQLLCACKEREFVDEYGSRLSWRLT